MVFGAHLFSSLEAESQMECAEAAKMTREVFARLVGSEKYRNPGFDPWNSQNCLCTGRFSVKSPEPTEVKKICNLFCNYRDLWNITMRTNVLFGREWKYMTQDLLLEFQNFTIDNVKKGYTGNDVGVKIWTFSAALLFSLTVFTTIGKPNCGSGFSIT